MRVISGVARGVPLKTVPDQHTRPILDRIKKSLFSMLDAAGLLNETRVADLYAGTGTQGIEALSRGAASCLFVEKRREAIALLHANLEKTRLTAQALVRCAQVRPVLEELARAAPVERFDLFLYDPPFAFTREDAERVLVQEELALCGRLLTPDTGRVVLRLESKVHPPEPPGLELARLWRDGPHAFAFYRLGA